mgnify:CR=1 FL=1|tara:strand:- start:941 stop:1129 length:189 start_codon:yes stop_codon:yes gene_type:complete
MSREIEITIEDDGKLSIEGYNLAPGEQIKDVAKFLTDQIAEVTEVGHKHKHTTMEAHRIKQS